LVGGRKRKFITIQIPFLNIGIFEWMVKKERVCQFLTYLCHGANLGLSAHFPSRSSGKENSCEEICLSNRQSITWPTVPWESSACIKDKLSLPKSYLELLAPALSAQVFKTCQRPFLDERQIIFAELTTRTKIWRFLQIYWSSLQYYFKSAIFYTFLPSNLV